MKLGSLFDGIGGFPLAASRYGITPVWASEIEPWPIKVTEHHFPDMKHLGDLTQISGAEIEPVDIITFGSPCQDLSVAGKREGLEGARSGLFMDAVRIIREMRTATRGQCPRFAVWENVPGAYSSNGGQDFRAVLEEIAEAEIPVPTSGKWAEAGMVRTKRVDVAWRTLDAQYWGVPQRRKRIFLVADFAGQCAAEVLFVEPRLSWNFETGGEAGQGDSADAERGVGKAEYLTGWDNQEKRVFGVNGVSPTLSGSDGGGGRTAAGYIAIPINDKATRHMGGGASRNHDGSGNGLGVGKPGDPCPTLTQGDKHAVACIEPGDTGTGIEKSVFNESGRGWISEGFGCLRCEGENRPSRPTHMVVEARDGVEGTIFAIAFGGAREQNVSSPLMANEGPNRHQGFSNTQFDAVCIRMREGSDGVEKPNCLTPWDCQSKRIYGPDSKWPTLYSREGDQAILIKNRINSTPEGISGAVSSKRAKGTGEPAGDECYNLVIEPRSQDGVCRVHQDNVPTLNTAGGGQRQPCVMAVDCRNLIRIRRLTPLECTRLQGFPDDWLDIEGMSDTAKYKAIGNSVAVPCVEYVMAGLRRVSDA